MCVIIIKEPGKTVDKDKLANACLVNRQGYGMCYVHKGKIKLFRKLEAGKDNDPDEIDGLLNKTLLDEQVFLHLRYTTVGEVSLDNSHPFVIMNKKEDGIDMAMMHNGTMGSWSPSVTDTTHKGWSDTRMFSTYMLRPLALRMAKYCSPAKILTDQVFRRVVWDYGGGFSVLVIFDSAGQHYIVNESRGEKYDGWWASNKYSFDKHHYRTGNNRQSSGNNAYGGTNYTRKSRDITDWEALVADAESDDHKNENSLQFEGWYNKVFNAMNLYETPLSRGTSVMTQTLDYGALEEKRKTFLEEAGLKDLDQCLFLTENELADLCDQYPAASASLIICLLAARETMKASLAKKVTADAAA